MTTVESHEQNSAKNLSGYVQCEYNSTEPLELNTQSWKSLSNYLFKKGDGTLHYCFALKPETISQIIFGGLDEFKPVGNSVILIEIFLDTTNYDLCSNNWWLKAIYNPQTKELSYSLKIPKNVLTHCKFVYHEELHDKVEIENRLSRYGSFNTIPELFPRVLAALTIHRTFIFKQQGCSTYVESVQLKPNDTNYYVLGTCSVSCDCLEYPPIEKLTISMPVLSAVIRSIKLTSLDLFYNLQPSTAPESQESVFSNHNYLNYNILKTQEPEVTSSAVKEAFDLLALPMPDYTIPKKSDWQKELDKIIGFDT